MAFNASAVHFTVCSILEKLRRTGHYSLRRVGQFLRRFLERYGAVLPTWPFTRPDRQRSGLLRGELSLDDAHGAGAKQEKLEEVFDLLNCGPRNRFVVKCADGSPLIVHNCENVVSSTARDLLAASLIAAENEGLNPVLTVHDELICEGPPGIGAALGEVMRRRPDWAREVPIDCEWQEGQRYGK